ncbi:MAG: GNAT family N-acetyltransferase [Deltaproteobacteria bacterium]|nr:GNAT family N-acetyltransferase [Deltaproteobacteria bacterium]
MKIFPFTIREVDWKENSQFLMNIRLKVFCEEQHVSYDEEFDGEDSVCRHYLAKDIASNPLGCCRLHPSGKLERMAVLKDRRGTNIGSELLKAAMNDAYKAGMNKVTIHAQTAAISFYEKFGFLKSSEEFLEARIPHIKMEIILH